MRPKTSLLSKPSPPETLCKCPPRPWLQAKEDDDGQSSGYQVSRQVTVQELMEKDAEDESLRKYKEQLLGAAGKVCLHVCLNEVVCLLYIYLHA